MKKQTVYEYKQWLELLDEEVILSFRSDLIIGRLNFQVVGEFNETTKEGWVLDV